MILLTLRSIALALHLQGGLLVALLLFGWLGVGARNWLTRFWSRNLLAILGVRLSVRGQALTMADRGVMLVANHVSWLDIFLLNAVRPVRFVAKSEVRAWPLLGRLATLSGTLYVERSRRKDISRVNTAIESALSQGDCLAFFPEGTTSDGRGIRPFLASLFQPVIDAGIPLQAVALRYIKPDGSPDLAPAYYDHIPLAQTLKQIMQQRHTHAEIIFLHRMESEGQSRKMLAIQCEQIISSALNLASPRTTPETPGDPQGAKP